MKNPLHSLDELVWKQFAKITEKAHQRYGRNGYDLAEAAFLGTSLSLAGTGCLSFQDYLHSGKPSEIVFGTANLLFAYLLHKATREKLSGASKKDYGMSLRGEYSFKYQPSAARPILLASSAWCFYPAPLSGLFFLTFAGGLYFSDQEFRPSGKKRNNVGRIVFKGWRDR